MLVAEKQLLDANLRNDLQQLRRLELKMLVNRYQTAIPAATLIVGFTFTSVVELEFLEFHHPTLAQQVCERLFYFFTSMALIGSIYAMAVSSIAIMLGQRLAVQATANLTAKHESNVKELGTKFIGVLVALAFSCVGVVGGTICAMWVKTEGVISVAATVMIVLLFPLTVYSIVTMTLRLNEFEDETGSVAIISDGKSARVNEFRVGDRSSIPVDVERGGAARGGPSGAPSGGQAAAGTGSGVASGTRPDERSSLLKCAFPPAKSH